MDSFQDHFSTVADHYLAARPGYPAELFDWLARQCRARDLAWDCATGNGQVALALTPFFKQTVATDASQRQLDQAPRHPRVHYAAARAECGSLADGSADLVTVAQAMHWFDIPRFHAEVQRVLKPDGFFAAITYGVQRIRDPVIGPLFDHLDQTILGAFWPPERRLVEDEYRTIDFPRKPCPAPDFPMQARWPLARQIGYVRSFSASARLCAAQGPKAIDDWCAELADVWGDPRRLVPVSWPLTVLAGWLGDCGR